MPATTSSTLDFDVSREQRDLALVLPPASVVVVLERDRQGHPAEPPAADRHALDRAGTGGYGRPLVVVVPAGVLRPRRGDEDLPPLGPVHAGLQEEDAVARLGRGSLPLDAP